MIIQNKDAQTKTSLIDLLGGDSKKGPSTKSNDLFSKLLNSFGMQTKDDEGKIVKSNDFKAIIDPKNSSVKNSDSKASPHKELQSLLTGSSDKESALVSNELLNSLSHDQVRTLINRAKEYLKNGITAKNPEYQVDEKPLPKTLAGLIKLAEKLGLEPQSITLSAVVNDPEEKASLTPELLSKPLLEAKALAALPAMIHEESPVEAITQLFNELKNKEQKKVKTDSTEISTHETSGKSEPQPLKALLQTLEKREMAANLVSLSETTNTPEAKPVSTAAANIKTDTLIALLQGTNENKEAPSETTNVLKSEGDSAKSVHLPKADSLEVKSKEAQQSMRLFASDLKEAVQEYKPPFTRLTMKLNPEKLGEVEVTLIQRGNNVHVNIQSNNTNSVAFLAHNATELKAQLASQGITNATMNFMSGGEGQSNPQSQQQEQRHNHFRSYPSFEELDLNEEQVSALEIIIPHYA
ncbi:flagellar hook-length control protein FliK [Sulfuricurvum sp.]|uniref:flagellar hook-length control protein FliK n=1 Tax=Sulfuricurvum sp. TaxID=2025608 RepID=UPI003C4DBCCC